MNENIFEYCKKFIQSKNSPHFAVLIKGEWGVGKTFFIKNMIKDLKLDKNDYVYLSLFGIKSIDDINVKIFEAMHPVLSSPQMKLAGSVLKSLLKLGADFKFDLPKGNKEGSIKIGLGEPSFKGVETLRSKRNLIIVDDIERLGDGLSIKDVFGFFQDIIVETDTKVIFIGNEDMIASDVSDVKHSYASVKEKTIGQDFLILPNPNDAIDVFIKELSINVKIEEMIKNSLGDIISALECKNLRCIRNALWGLNEYSDLIIKDIYDDADKKMFVSTYLLLSIQKNLNYINQNDDILEVLKVYQSYHIGYDCYKKRKEEDNLDVSFVILNLPFLNNWGKIIFDGENSRDVLNGFYLIEKKAQKRNKKQSLLFNIINSWREFDNDIFKKNVDELKKEFDQGKYLHPGEILHYANIMLLFSYWKIRPETYQSIEKQIKNVYSNYKVKTLKDFEMLKMGFGGWSYSTDYEPMNKIFDYVEMENNKCFQSDLSKSVIQDVDNLSDENIDDFCKNLWRCNGTNKYWKFPFFKYVDVEIFCKKINELNSRSIDFLLQSLDDRYGLRYSSPADVEFREDVENLKKIKDVYMKGRRTVRNSPKNLLAKRNAEHLEKLIKHIENTTNVVYIKPRSN